LEALAECGVVVTLIREIPGAGVSGATRWMGKNRAHIQLSLRHKTDDQFWFSFFHEVGHILHHGKEAVFLENEHSEESEQEEEANCFAREVLIPSRYVDELHSLGSKAEIVRFAEKLNIAPGIVVGRLQFDGLLGYPQGNAMRLKRKFVWSE